MEDLWHAHYEILSIIFLNELVELDVDSHTIIKNVKHVALNISILTVFVNSQILKVILWNPNFYGLKKKIISTSLTKN